MKNIIKIVLNFFINTIISILSKFNIGRYILEKFLNGILKKKTKIMYKNLELEFHDPNRLIHYRIKSFSSKEPETLNWIDSFEDKSVFYDVGANIGLYSIYAAKKKNCQTFSFEPSPFNLGVLVKNIFLNNLEDNIKLISMPLSDKTQSNMMKMSNIELGGALSNFGNKSSKIPSVLKYSTVSLSLDEARRIFNFPQPQYIKIDVDGIESLILSGGKEVIKNTKSILVEINENNSKDMESIKNYFDLAGFKFYKKTPLNVKNEMFFNYIWKKN